MDNELLMLDNQLCFRLYYISRKMIKAYQPLLKKYQLTYPQYIVMLAMFEHEKVGFKDLSRYVNLAEGTLTPVLKRLEKKSYIKKEKNPKDSRRIEVILTDEGYRLSKEIVEVPQGLAEGLQLSINQYNELVKKLDELDNLLDDMDELK